jgi:hypothetical protein
MVSWPLVARVGAAAPAVEVPAPAPEPAPEPAPVEEPAPGASRQLWSTAAVDTE